MVDIRQWLLPDCEVVGFDGGDTPLEHSVFSSFSRFRIQDFRFECCGGKV